MEDDRYERGCARADEVIGVEARERLIDSNKVSAPHLSRYVLENVWGDLFTRNDQLDLRSREIATIAALTAIGDCIPQLKVHIIGALNAGVTRGQISEVITHVAALAGVPRALNASQAAREVFESLSETTAHE